MLAVDAVHSYYGKAHILQGVSLEVGQGAFVTLLGRNGAGKSTTLKTIMGIVTARRGRVTLAGRDITALPCEEIARCGVAYVPEDRGIIPNLTTAENLRLGLLGSAVPAAAASGVARAFEYFPALERLAGRRGGLLSGGEQQMLALARALVARPQLMLIDEPTEGLSPLLVQAVVEALEHINRSGTTILLVEQNFEVALRLSTHIYVIDQGRIAFGGPPAVLSEDEQLQYRLLGV